MFIEQASKEQLAECARLLALNLAHYQGLYGEVPLDEVLAALDTSAPNDDQAKLVAGGMENLVGVLCSQWVGRREALAGRLNAGMDNNKAPRQLLSRQALRLEWARVHVCSIGKQTFGVDS